MLRMQQHQDGLLRRLTVIGIPTYCRKPFVGLMVRWESCSGIEWTIKRLKGLKVDLLRSKAGLEPICPIWVRKNKKGEFYGTIGSLFSWARQSDKNFSKVVQALMAYTFYILPSLTETQKKKFLTGINPEKTDDGLTKGFHKSFSQTVSRTIRRRPVLCEHRPLVTYQGGPGKKAPRLFGQRSVPQDENILDDLQLFNTPGGQGLYMKYKRLYRPLMLGMDARLDFLDSLSYYRGVVRNDPVYCGEIHFIQEPGGKLRSVASPFRIHQEALRPFGQMLYDLVRSLPWDCTHEQSLAIPAIQSHLRAGGQVHSIDLSSATDLFPLSLQETALRAVTKKEDWDHIDLFIEISRGFWKNSELGVLRWTKGQPLGLYPSFASFTLTHGLLLLHLLGCPYDNQFFVLGDDVVILDEQLKDKYIDVLDRMGCPYSVDKSLSSNKLAEFAGKVITPTMVIPQLKWRRMSNDNFLDVCRLLGSKSYCLLSSRQKAVFDQVAHLCEPIGLNFSIPGNEDSLEKMVQRTVDFYQPEKVVLGSLMGLRRRINKIVHSSAEIVNSDELDNLSLTFDEKVKSVLCQTVFSRWETSILIGLEALDTLPQALGLYPRLPLRDFLSTRQTTLERYERVLQLRKSAQ